MVDQADPELQDHLASLANHHQKSALLPRPHHANHAHLANLASQDHKVLPATPAQLEIQATLAKMVNQAAQARKVHPAHQATQVLMDHEVIQVRQLSALQPLPETPDPPAQMDHLAQLVNQAPKETMATQEAQAPKAHQAQLAAQAKMVLPETKDHQVQMDPKENRVSARNTALWTAVSSSKMEQDVKNLAHHFSRSFLQSRLTNGYGERSLLFAVDPFLLLLIFSYLKQRSNSGKPHNRFPIPFLKCNMRSIVEFTVDLYIFFKFKF
jgi:hypothetical protein